MVVVEDGYDKTDLDQQDDNIQINTEFKLEKLYKKGKQEMIAQELKKLMRNAP